MLNKSSRIEFNITDKILNMDLLQNDLKKNLKNNKKTKNIPVIVFTNFDKEEINQRAVALGAVGYVIKSKVVPSEIVKKVAEVLKL